MDDIGLLIFVLLIYLLAAAIIVVLLALVVLAATYNFKFWPQHRRKIVKVLAGAGVTIAVVLAVMVATGMISWPEPDHGDEKHVVAAARGKVKSQFRNPEQVQFQEVWLGEDGPPFEKHVCGTVDSDEITNASRFIFTTDPYADPAPGKDGQQGGRERDRLQMDFPPTIDGSKPTDAAYWESVTDSLDSFSRQWTVVCEKQRPGAEQGEEQ